MSAGKAFLLVMSILLVMLLIWAIITSVGNALVEPPLEHLWFALIVRSVLHTFFEHFVAALVMCGLLTFSLLVSPSDLGEIGTGLIRSLRPVLYVILVAGILNGIWFGVFAPRTELRIQQIAHQSRTARDALSTARQHLNDRSWATAEEQLLLHQALVGETEEVADLLRQARAGLIEEEQLRRAMREQPRREESPRVHEAREMTVAEMVSLARRFLEQEDFFSAHHFATLALEQSRTPRQDARRIQADALNAIMGGTRLRTDESIRQIYQDKVAAYEAFVRGETIPEKALEAYYRFQDLERRIPEDPDVRQFVPLARERARRVSFFVEEARSIEMLPGRSNLVFLNRRTAEGVEVISVDTLVRVRTGDYLFGVEVMRTGENGRVLLHLRARYGKVIGDRLVMRAILQEGEFRDGEANVTGPIFYVGSPSDLEDALVLHHRVDDFARFAGGPDTLTTLSLPELVRLSPVMSGLGRTPHLVHAALMNRLLRIGGFFIIAFFSVSLGWRLRSRYVGRPPLIVLLLLPVVLGIIWWAVTLLRYLLHVSTTVVASLLPLSAAIAVTALGIIVGTVLAVFALAQQKIAL